MVDDRLADVTSAGCDAGIRYGEHPVKDTSAALIGARTQTLAPAAAPGYLALQGSPSYPADLASHDCIRVKYSSGVLRPREFEYRGKAVKVNPVGRLIIGIDGAAAAINFAKQGRGIICSLREPATAPFRNWRACCCTAGIAVCF
ncbi:LysR substrate-binding domain-containing protein [Pantoea brenneri]|uniref:LysR substrate-binding domain-containing protein n=1 Tax=Pantoea brenneri TaxID=472694 RepID=UPI0028A06E2A|nr:LysR substrate-binding domain-containing protein [Pantoea brenneri]